MKHQHIDPHTLDRTKSVTQHSKDLGIPFTTLKRELERAGLYEQFPRIGGQEAARQKARAVREAYAQHPKKCAHCDKPLTFEQKDYRFCSYSCVTKASFRNSERGAAQSAEIKRRMAEGTWQKPSPPHAGPLPRIIKNCKHCAKPMELAPYQARNDRKRFCSRECAHAGYTGGSGGYREGSGRGKSGWYRGLYCSSTWELAWVIYQLDQGVAFTRNNEGFQYTFEDVSHLYYPDFQLADGTYVEVKGYETPQWRAKLAQFPHPIQVLSEPEMKPVLQYVKERYGPDFVELYEGNPHKEKRNQCVVCGEPARNLCCSRLCAGKRAKTMTRQHKAHQSISPAIG